MLSSSTSEHRGRISSDTGICASERKKTMLSTLFSMCCVVSPCLWSLATLNIGFQINILLEYGGGGWVSAAYLISKVGVGG